MSSLTADDFMGHQNFEAESLVWIRKFINKEKYNCLPLISVPTLDNKFTAKIDLVRNLTSDT